MQLKEESKENHEAAVKAMLGLYDAVWRDFTFRGNPEHEGPEERNYVDL